MTGIAYDEESKTEIVDEGPFEVLHMHGFPSDIVPAINRYNREHRGPDGNTINISQTCIDALRKALKEREAPEVPDHPLMGLTHIPNVGPVELKRAADLIKGMGYRPDNEPMLRGRECQCIVEDEGIGTGDTESDVRAQTRDEMEYNGKSIYLCPIHVEAITEMEYEHLYVKGHCKVCDRPLVRYDMVNF